MCETRASEATGSVLAASSNARKEMIETASVLALKTVASLASAAALAFVPFIAFVACIIFLRSLRHLRQKSTPGPCIALDVDQVLALQGFSSYAGALS